MPYSQTCPEKVQVLCLIVSQPLLRSGNTPKVWLESQSCHNKWALRAVAVAYKMLGWKIKSSPSPHSFNGAVTSFRTVDLGGPEQIIHQLDWVIWSTRSIELLWQPGLLAHVEAELIIDDIVPFINAKWLADSVFLDYDKTFVLRTNIYRLNNLQVFKFFEPLNIMLLVRPDCG